MSYEKFVSNLPRHNRASFSSVEETQEVMDNLGINQQMKQLGRGGFQGDMSVRVTKDAELFADRFNKGLSIYLAPAAERIGFFIPHTIRGSFTVSGSTISNDKLLIVDEDIGVDIVSPDLLGSESICISKSRFNELAEVLCPSVKLQEITSAIKGDTTQLHALRNGILELMNQQAEPDDEQLSNLLSSIISWTEKSINTNPYKSNLYTIKEKTRIARLAQDFIHANFRKDVRIEDICRISGVGVRTLQRSFKEHFNLTITEYIKAERLDAAHRELSGMATQQFTVTETALKSGFKHLGRFSTDFHKRFGSCPSDMVGRKHH